jgi:uncharacterized protein (DUF4213/DUF364 family)
MTLPEDLLGTLPDGRVVKVRMGTHWTAVVVEVSGELRCGLASTLLAQHDHHRVPDVPQAGELETYPARELASLIHSGKPTLASIATATINALLPKDTFHWIEKNAEEVISEAGVGKAVVVVGRFPFSERIRSRVGNLTILEQRPEGDELPEEDASKVLPLADVVAITGMTFINRTLEKLLKFCSREALVLVLGPSTPLSPILFEYGIHLLSGALVMDIDRVLRTIGQGANFRQVHRAGVSLVTIDRQASRGVE